MNIIILILLLFSSISFLIYGTLLLFSSKMKEEFERFELKQFATLVGGLELLGGLGLLAGIINNSILLISSAGLSLLMLLGLGVRLKMKDGFLLSFPSFFFMIINFIIFLNTLYLYK